MIKFLVDLLDVYPGLRTIGEKYGGRDDDYTYTTEDRRQFEKTLVEKMEFYRPEIESLPLFQDLAHMSNWTTSMFKDLVHKSLIAIDFVGPITLIEIQILNDPKKIIRLWPNGQVCSGKIYSPATSFHPRWPYFFSIDRQSYYSLETHALWDIKNQSLAIHLNFAPATLTNRPNHVSQEIFEVSQSEKDQFANKSLVQSLEIINGLCHLKNVTFEDIKLKIYSRFP